MTSASAIPAPRPAPGRGLAVAAVAGIPLVLALAGLALSLTRPRFDDLVAGHELGDAAMAVACGLVAALILSRRPGHPVGRVFAVIGLADGVGVLASGLADMTAGGGEGTAHVWAVWLAGWTWAPGLLLSATLLPLVVPEGAPGRLGRVPLGRVLVRADAAVVAAVCVCQALSPRLATGPDTSVANPLGVAGADVAGLVAQGMALLAALVSLGVLAVRLVRADDRLRRQLLPLLAAAVVAVAVAVTAEQLGTAGVVLADLSQLLLPAAALLSVLRLRLYDFEVAFARTLGWLLLSGLLVGGYVVVVELSASWLRLHGRTATVVATAAVAVAFAPTKAWLERLVARWLYGDRGDPYSALTHTTQVLSGGADPLGALEQATADLARRLRCPGVRVLRGGSVLAGAAVGQAALAVPLRSGDVEVGTLEILPRGPGEAFSRADERLVLDLCPPLSHAVASVGLTEELRAARERLVVAREAERRRVRRELHDDVGPSLAAASLQAETALRRLARSDAAAATDALTALRRTIDHAAADLRSAVDSLGPRVVEEAGLAEAVRSLADAGTPEVCVEVEPLPSLPAAVEVAVYRVLAEAVTNARRHAGARRILVTLAVAGDRLQATVVDDGVGAGSARRRGGLGVPSMRVRIEDLGGTFSVAPGPRAGTVVAASVPVLPVPVPGVLA